MTRLMTIDPLALRDALGQYATGVTIVTTLDEAGRPAGLTVNSFTSVSLDPPLALWSITLTAACLPAFKASTHFAVNVLSAEQVELSNRFATAGEDKFAGLDWSRGLGGAPLLAGCCAVFECRTEVTHPGGDHLIFIGRIERFSREKRDPLVFHGGRYCARAALTEE